jgi:hypothetical protein
MATIDLGRVYALQHRLANSSREGAAYAVLWPGRVSTGATCADPENVTYHALGEPSNSTGYTVVVKNVTSGANITGCADTGIADGTKVKVTVSASFTPLTFFAKTFVGSTPTISRSTQIVVNATS